MCTMSHILWCIHSICSLSSSKLPLNYLYFDLVNPLWDGLLEHDINSKTCNSITLRGLFNLKSTVMGHVVKGILNKYNILNWKNINLWFVNQKNLEITSFWEFWGCGLTQSLLTALRLTLACSHPSDVDHILRSYYINGGGWGKLMRIGNVAIVNCQCWGRGCLGKMFNNHFG